MYKALTVYKTNVYNTYVEKIIKRYYRDYICIVLVGGQNLLSVYSLICLWAKRIKV